MSKLVRDVVQLDLQAQENIRRLTQEKEDLAFELAQKRQQMEKDYQMEIQHMQAMLYEEAERLQAQASANFHKKEIDLKQQILHQFQENKEAWLQAMFSLLVSED